MTTLTLELPTPLRSKIAQLKIPTEQVHSFVIQALEVWVGQEAQSLLQQEKSASLSLEVKTPFKESAVPFIDELISQNQALFEELANDYL